MKKVRTFRERKTQKREVLPKSLNKRLLLFMLFCWVVPIAIFFIFTTFSYRDGIMDKSERLMRDQLSNVAAFASIRIDDAISLCQRPSYEKTWENAWKGYQEGKTKRTDYLREINGSLKGKFYLDERFNLYAFYAYDDNNPSCYSSRTGISYNAYIEKVQPFVAPIKGLDSSYTYVKVIDGRIFIIRNLYTTNAYQKFGTLVVELNKRKVFQDLSQEFFDHMVVCIGDTKEQVTLANEALETDKDLSALTKQLLMDYDNTTRQMLIRHKRGSYNGYLYQEKFDDYHIGVVYWIKRNEVYASLYDLYFIVILMFVLFIPLIGYGIYFLKKEIQQPLVRMLAASKRMEEGEIGIEVEGDMMPNAEFTYLMKSFNSMSAQVKSLFDSIYNEKLARKDAQIEALQAQINPHFLNNTLEMMNWQARMSKDVTISKMIEALGTVLNYRMNRTGVKEIHLAEELACADAYFYIMSMRFGKRLQVEKEVDESLLDILVPPLILQPIVENAVVHGVEMVKNGTIFVRIYHDDNSIYLEVKNSGKLMSEEETKKMQRLLEEAPEGTEDKKEGHTSIGIRNVNLRIKLVYGSEYGLHIWQESDGMITSSIRLPFSEEMARIYK
ncbi:MAG: two-component system, sensor histidine kinase YesM [Clostridiales bacterium]|nr:two-component system, sensor histidine kinase YesM [Clostridiales bacterium]